MCNERERLQLLLLSRNNVVDDASNGVESSADVASDGVDCSAADVASSNDVEFTEAAVADASIHSIETGDEDCLDGAADPNNSDHTAMSDAFELECDEDYDDGECCESECVDEHEGCAREVEARDGPDLGKNNEKQQPEGKCHACGHDSTVCVAKLTQLEQEVLKLSQEIAKLNLDLANERVATAVAAAGANNPRSTGLVIWWKVLFAPTGVHSLSTIPSDDENWLLALLSRAKKRLRILMFCLTSLNFLNTVNAIAARRDLC